MSLRRVLAPVPRTVTGLAACGALLVLGLPGAGEPSLSLTAGTASFTIAGTVLAVPAGSDPDAGCTGGPAALLPGVPRCIVYRVDNHLDTPITVRTITMTLDPSFPPPPTTCSRGTLVLPTFTGALTVPGNGTAHSPGLAIMLESTGTNQDSCKDSVLHFAFAGTAVESDSGKVVASDSGRPLAYTGADVGPAALLGSGLLVLGAILVLAARRRRPADGHPR